MPDYNSCIRKIVGTNISVVNADIVYPIRVAIDLSGNLYVVSDSHLIHKVTNGITSVFLGGGATYPTVATVGTNVSFNDQRPVSIFFDGTSKLYIGTASGILSVTIATATAILIAGSPTQTPGYINGIGTNAMFNRPIDFEILGNTLYVCEISNHMIRQMDLVSKTVTTLVGGGAWVGGVVTKGRIDSIGTSALFDNPTSCLLDTSGNLFIVDRGNNTIRKCVVSTGAVTTIVGGQLQGLAGNLNSDGINALFNFPSEIEGINGQLFVADSVNNSIKVLSPLIGNVFVPNLTAPQGFQGATGATGLIATGTPSQVIFYGPTGQATSGPNMLLANSNLAIGQIGPNPNQANLEVWSDASSAITSAYYGSDTVAILTSNTTANSAKAVASMAFSGPDFIFARIYAEEKSSPSHSIANSVGDLYFQTMYNGYPYTNLSILGAGGTVVARGAISAHSANFSTMSVSSIVGGTPSVPSALSCPLGVNAASFTVSPSASVYSINFTGPSNNVFDTGMSFNIPINFISLKNYKLMLMNVVKITIITTGIASYAKIVIILNVGYPIYITTEDGISVGMNLNGYSYNNTYSGTSGILPPRVVPVPPSLSGLLLGYPVAVSNFMISNLQIDFTPII